MRNFVMSIRLSVAALLGVILCAGPALAASPSALLRALDHCAGVSSGAARLACYDGLAPRVRAKVSGKPVTQSIRAQVQKKQQESWFGFNLGGLFGNAPSEQTKPSQFGSDNLPVQVVKRNSKTQAIDSISARLKDYAFNPFGKFIITLANGQIWKQLDADDAHAVFHKDPSANRVKITRGFLGSYNLYINGGYRVFKVRRLR
jgi:hypothetical protein